MSLKGPIKSLSSSYDILLDIMGICKLERHSFVNQKCHGGTETAYLKGYIFPHAAPNYCYLIDNCRFVKVAILSCMDIYISDNNVLKFMII